jgi:hypothetical protein
MLSVTLCRVAAVRNDVSENAYPPTSKLLRDRIPQLCYHGIAVNQPLHREMLFLVEEHRLQGCLHSGINDICLLGPCVGFKMAIVQGEHSR